MSIVEPTLLSFARATAVSLATLALLLAAGSGVRSMPRTTRAAVFWMAMAALMMPGFAVAFTYFDSAMKRDAFGREQLYCCLVWLRCSPLALLVVWLMPPSLSGEAMHCLRRGTSLRWWRRGMWELRAWGRGLWFAVAVVFLLAFQESELATTWSLRAWPVALFDAQAGGFALGESLRLVALPFFVQATLIAVLARFSQTRMDVSGPRENHTLRAAVPVATAVVGFLSVCAAPALAIAGGTSVLFYAGRLEVLTSAPWREIGNGLGIAVTATAFAWLFAGWIRRRRWRFAFALPGLFGPMLCGLMLLAMLQVPPFFLLRDTVFPAVLGQMLMLLPLALLLHVGIAMTRDDTALHMARAAGGRLALWQAEGRQRLCALLLLFCFAYGDFTINSLLAPPQFTSASVRLLNLLHYGRSEMLRWMFLLAFAVPLLAALLTALIARFYPRPRAS